MRPKANPIKDSYARRVLEGMTVAVIVLDCELRLVFMNPAAEMLFAQSFRQALGMSFQDLALGVDKVVRGMRQCLQSGHPYTERELELQLAGDETITVDCTVSVLLDKEAPVELLMELRQVDRQLRINREENLLAQQQTARALARNLAHEVKNPLGGIRGAAQLLEREFADDSLKEYTRIIIGEADRLRNLVDRMLGPTHPPMRSKINIHEVVERVRSLVTAECGPGLRIDRDYDPSIPPVSGDSDQLIQAVLNIVRNAVQALENQGLIVLRTRIRRQYTIGHQRYKLVACLEVIDNGPGIPKELLQEIFYPMISGRAQGTGLGLSIAQHLVSQHGGLIECKSRPGETVFTLLLPLERNDG